MSMPPSSVDAGTMSVPTIAFMAYSEEQKSQIQKEASDSPPRMPLVAMRPERSIFRYAFHLKKQLKLPYYFD